MGANLFWVVVLLAAIGFVLLCVGRGNKVNSFASTQTHGTQPKACFYLAAQMSEAGVPMSLINAAHEDCLLYDQLCHGASTTAEVHNLLQQYGYDWQSLADALHNDARNTRAGCARKIKCTTERECPFPCAGGVCITTNCTGGYCQ